MNSMSCCYCGKNCIGKYAFWFEIIESFTPVGAKEFMASRDQFVFCEKCAEPIHDTIERMCVMHGGTLSK